MLRFGLLLAVVCTSACTAPGLVSDGQLAQSIAAPAGLVAHLRVAPPFVLATRERVGQAGADVTVYIEGDGAAWITRTQPSHDPTPDDPIALRLAALDPSPNVAWIARPCQYVPMQHNPPCHRLYWTDGRFAEPVVSAMDAAVTAVKEAMGAQHVHLVGYSGGGGVAALVAARRTDVRSLRTLAGNLDHTAFTTYHRVTPMAASLNPADFAGKLAAIAQIHYVGSDDNTVPARVAQSYVRRMADTHCTSVVPVAGATHSAGWEAAWGKTVGQVPDCPAFQDTRGTGILGSSKAEK
jgi:hypothetical protein